MLPRIHPDHMQIAFDDHCAPASSLFYWNRAWPVRLPYTHQPGQRRRGGFERWLYTPCHGVILPHGHIDFSIFQSDDNCRFRII